MDADEQLGMILDDGRIGRVVGWSDRTGRSDQSRRGSVKSVGTWIGWNDWEVRISRSRRADRAGRLYRSCTGRTVWIHATKSTGHATKVKVVWTHATKNRGHATKVTSCMNATIRRKSIKSIVIKSMDWGKSMRVETLL